MSNPSGSRAEAVLSVLRGESVTEVAKSLSVAPEVVLHWVDLFCEGGEARLADEAPLAPGARDRFLTLISHEFRTPLSIISGWVDVMLDTGNGLADEARSGALLAIRRQVAHLDRVSRDALDAGALARGQLRLMVAPLQLRALVSAVLSSLNDARVALSPGPEIEVVADSSRLEQAVGGLVEHARRLAEGQAVQVSLAEGPTGQALLSASVPGKEIGIGDAATLFEPYARSDTSFGTGLGLYLCRAIIAAHGGEIGLRSEAGSTTFWSRLPLAGPSMNRLVQRN